ncbi:MAG: AmmeMemoRadiSam system protein B [Planctomycetota bacterium]|nr:AmmeMemoRadiSam system protein B [Planctomycetota bacterium]
MMKRQPYRAGSFYEAGEDACRRSARKLLDDAEIPNDLPEALFGGLVPHAGWVFSGLTASMTFKALASRNRLGRVVIFGADHWGTAGDGAVFDKGAWLTPLGEVAIDEELSDALLGGCSLLRADSSAHNREHSIEVQLPLMQVACGDVRIVPINISPSPEAVRVGREVGEVLKGNFPDASVIASTDLTHYGPQYGFTPGGTGPAGLKWAEENDARLLKLIETMQAEDVISETSTHRSACGGGAIAATIAACSVMGATSGLTLKYTTSAEVMRQVYGNRCDEAVGYVSVVFA